MPSCEIKWYFCHLVLLLICLSRVFNWCICCAINNKILLSKLTCFQKKKSMKLLGKQSTQTWITHFSKECTGRYRQYSSISRLLILIESPQHLCYCIAKAILKELSSLNTPKRLQTWKKSYKNPITSVRCNSCCQMLLPVQSPVQH